MLYCKHPLKVLCILQHLLPDSFVIKTWKLPKVNEKSVGICFTLIFACFVNKKDRSQLCSLYISFGNDFFCQYPRHQWSCSLKAPKLCTNHVNRENRVY